MTTGSKSKGARAAAIAAGLPHYEGTICNRGHTPNRRYVTTGLCVDCNRDAARAVRRSPPVPKTPVTARYSLAAMWRRTCPSCGPESLFVGSQCASCGHNTDAKQERRRYRHARPQLTMAIAEGANILALMGAKS